MNWKSLIVGVRNSAAVLCILGAGTLATSHAFAKCGDVVQPKPPHSSAGLKPVLYRPVEDEFKAIKVKGEDWFYNRSIIGLWEFEVHLKGAQNGLPDGALLDWGLATWHEDETEIQFSAGRPPSSGDVCMGVWRQVGKAKYKLHHVALGLTPATASGIFVGPTVIRAEVTVDHSGESFSGPYTLTVYPGSPEAGTEFDESGLPLVMFTAFITAKKVEID